MWQRVAQIWRFYGDELKEKEDTFPSSDPPPPSPSLFAHNLISIPERLGGLGRIHHNHDADVSQLALLAISTPRPRYSIHSRLIKWGGKWHGQRNRLELFKVNQQGSLRYNEPVTGASMSIIVFSWRSRAAPSLMMRRAAASSIRPSKMKCCLSTSGRGLPVFVSNTSATDNLRLGGNGTPIQRQQELVTPTSFFF